MAVFNMSATLRGKSGKGAARQARLANRVPAIVYGGKAPIAITVDPKELTKAVMGPLRRNQVVSLDVKDEKGAAQGKRIVLVRELQTHPVRRNAIHVDFVEISMDKPVRVEVPLEATGKAKALLDGAKMSLVVRTLHVEVMPDAIPEKIVHDVTDQGFGVVRAKAITMPKGVKLLNGPETPVVSLRMPRGEKEEEVAAGTPAEGAVPAAGAAPAAAAAAGDKKGAEAAKPDAKGGDKKK